MKNDILIKTSRGGSSELIIHPAKADEIGLSRKKFAHISFGNQKHYVKILINDEISPEHVVLSDKLIEALHLPDYTVYEISLAHNEIIIGPYIGLLLSKEDRRLTTSSLNKMLVYVSEYAKLHGAIVVFALDKVNRADRFLEGYCYNPVLNCWQRGKFPYPASLYRTIGLSEAWKNHFLSAMGDKIFNSRYFNKWQMYQWFSNDNVLNPHIPYTSLYHSPQDIFDMLKKFQKFYLKPVSGLRGRGIVRIGMENRLLIFKYHENLENYQIAMENSSKAREYIQKRFVQGKYLIQQAVDLLEHQGGVIDFRCVVQKNQSNAWVCMAIIGRAGGKDSIVSNISSGGSAFPAEELLRKVLATSEKGIADLKQKIATLARNVCNTLDEYGINCGTLGLDIGVDKEGRLWLIEINNRDPDPTIALDIRDQKLYHALKTGPLFYAKFLAGFKNR
jgi:glutathione synthase/RimK-type ligase-like ATP-grasp enzyme